MSEEHLQQLQYPQSNDLQPEQSNRWLGNLSIAENLEPVDPATFYDLADNEKLAPPEFLNELTKDLYSVWHAKLNELALEGP